MSIILTIMALAPAIVLCVYIYIKDKTEKEPVSLLLKLFLYGIVSIIPSIFGEEILGYINELVFSPFLLPGVTVDHMPSHIPAVEPIYQFCHAFFVVALVEEGFKWILLRIGTNKNKHFNSFFDGIIYAVFVSLGFAAFENLLYVHQYGFATAVTRAVLSVPGHMFFSVFMGYFSSMYIIDLKALEAEKALKAKGSLPAGANRIKLGNSGFLSIAMPVLAHGLYDFCLFYSNTITMLIFIAFMIFMYVYCFRKISKTSKNDTSHVGIICTMLGNKYPQLTFTPSNKEE